MILSGLHEFERHRQAGRSAGAIVQGLVPTARTVRLIFGTLICDLDGLYDPATYNDRLLLGLKGTMSEAELHIIRQRMLQGAAESRRGELVTTTPATCATITVSFRGHHT